ncbi:MAG: hypothetical protein WBD20_03500 [Pirellulaceae bacterium]
MLRIHFVGFLFVLLATPCSLAQDWSSPTKRLSGNSNTKHGQRVAVRVADPFASVEQEQTLLRLLHAPYSFEWHNQTTVRDVQRDLAEEVAFDLDLRAMEEMGIEPDAIVFPSLDPPARVPKTNPSDAAPYATSDPFGPAADTGVIQHPSTQTRVSVTPTQWWQRQPNHVRTTVGARRPTNGGKLLHGLESLDLVIANWSGQWVITTLESAEEHLSTRLYEVTPLSVMHTPRDREPMNVGQFGGGGYAGGFSGGFTGKPKDALIDIIETSIQSDTWESLGGPSTLRLVEQNGQTWLVISTLVTTHWKVEALLNRLNAN